MRKIMRIDLSTQKTWNEDLPEAYKRLGGRSLTSAIVSDEVPPQCHSLRAHNKGRRVR